MTARERQYTWDFEPDVSLPEAIRTIAAALDDDGLALTANDNGTYSRIHAVLVDGVKRVIVPGHRVVEKATQYPPLRVLSSIEDVLENER